MIYLDYAASSPMEPQSLAAYVDIATHIHANPSSLHDEGEKAASAIRWARQTIAKKLGVTQEGIIFTGSGTEGNILAIVSLAKGSKRGKHIVTSMAEHTSVHAAMNRLALDGYEITKLPLNAHGVISIDELQKSVRSDTALIVIQHVNSEIGTIQPIREITAFAKEQGVLIHVDCVQSFCKLDVTTFSHRVDGLSVSAHKIGGPKGCGAIFLNPAVRLAPVFPGVTHERGLRGGTLNTPAIVAMAVAVEEYRYDLKKQWRLRDAFVQQLGKRCEVIGATGAEQLPNIVGVCKRGMEGQYVMLKLNDVGICISTGSACDINSASGTKAILAMGKDFQTARQFFRVSFGLHTTMEEVETCAQEIAKLNV